ncbi:hypothetical protein ACLQ2R_19790 [Streptosporangium sp. DT93]|uniref:hypothetical protein n=1 Tax=Streptosporangium sp. DT93 TaxID=3393428 RepID=UPI003CF98E4A
MTLPRVRLTVLPAVLLSALVTPLLIPAAAHASASYTCGSGYAYLSPIQVLGPYEITADGCTGSGTDEPGVITIPSGTYGCDRVWALPGGGVRGVRCDGG